jgi:hypothetical protein
VGARPRPRRCDPGCSRGLSAGHDVR